MAILYENSVCALCGETLDRPFLATSGCAFPQEHRLWRYCDAPLHVDCLQDWPDRVEFCSAYYRQRLDQYAEEKWFVLASGDGWFCGKALPYPGSVFAEEDNKFVEVRVEDWPITFLTEAGRWSEFLESEWQTSGVQLHGYALARAQVVISEVREVIPDTNTLFKLIARAEDLRPVNRTSALSAPADAVARALFDEFVEKPISAIRDLLNKYGEFLPAIEEKMRTYQFASVLVVVLQAEQHNRAFESVRESLEKLFFPPTLVEGAELLENVRGAMRRIAELLEPGEEPQLIGWAYNWLRTVGVIETKPAILASFVLACPQHYVEVAKCLRRFETGSQSLV